jgi:hypothetical protein
LRRGERGDRREERGERRQERGDRREREGIGLCLVLLQILSTMLKIRIDTQLRIQIIMVGYAIRVAKGAGVLLYCLSTREDGMAYTVRKDGQHRLLNGPL